MNNTTSTTTGSTMSGATLAPIILPEKTGSRDTIRNAIVSVKMAVSAAGNCGAPMSTRYIGSSTQIAPGGRRHACEVVRGEWRLVRIVHGGVKTGQAQPSADRKDHGGDPADIVEIVQLPKIENKGWGHTEIDEVRETVELGAKARLALDHASYAAINAVQYRGEYDRGQRQLIAPFDGEPDGRQARTDRQQRDDVGHQHPDRNLAKPPAAQIRRSWVRNHWHKTLYNKSVLLRHYGEKAHRPDRGRG